MEENLNKRMKKKKILNLINICNSDNPRDVAIEYYSEQIKDPSQDFNVNCTSITYFKIHKAQNALKSIILKNVKLPQQFIGIHADTPIYCIPTLIFGIISSGHAFVYLPKDQPFLITKLNIEYLFLPKNTEKIIIKSEIIKKFVMHKEFLIFLKSKVTSMNSEHDNSDETNKDSVNKFKNKNYFAYAITTSGSTGTPVIIKVTHASLLPNILDFKEIFKLSNIDKIAHLTPLTFDPSMIEIFLSFSTGGTLITFSKQLKNDPKKLLNILHNNEITFISTTPSLFLHRGWSLSDLQSTLLGADSKLSILLLGGEPFPKLDVISKVKHPENSTRIFNVYGITEVSCWASINEIFCKNQNEEEPYQQFNLGTPLSDTIFQVRDIDSNDIIDEGDGILYIGSCSRICVIDNERLNENGKNFKLPLFRNSKDLVTINKSGQIIFRGRQGNCIKRYGHKVYLNELNNHVQNMIYIKASYSIVFPPLNKLYLLLTLTKEFINHRTIITDVWKYVKLLPSVMHPDVIHILNNFKITPNGKICENYLKNMCLNIEHLPCVSKDMISLDIKKLMQESWMNHLQCYINNIFLSKFLDVGGTSVIALQIYSELVDKSQKNFPNLVGMLLENRTLEDCLNYVSQYCCDNDNNLNEYSMITNIEKSEFLVNNYTNSMCCTWQKCRGKTKISNQTLYQSILGINNEYINWDVFNVTDCRTYNLKKCIDASPTIFGYSSLKRTHNDVAKESAFLCVGSHAGIICTVELPATQFDNDYKKWEFQLPQHNNIIPRIEASILVLDEFKGIVGCHDGNIYCLHLKTGEIYWNFSTGNIVKCSAVICSKKQNIYVGSYDHNFYCITAKEGSLVWKRNINASICSTPLVHDKTNSVIISLLNGICISLDQTTGEIHWEYKFENAIFSSPIALTDDVVIITDVSGNLTGLNIDHNNRESNNCKKLWNFCIPSLIFSDIVVHTSASNLQNLIFATKNGIVYKYYFDNFNSVPKLKYKVDCGFMIASTPLVNNSVIIIVREDGVMKIIDYQKGCFLHTFDLGCHSCFSSPVLHRDFIAVGGRDDNLYILRLKMEVE